MRRVRVTVVLECGGRWEDAWARPVAAFESRELAERCADVRERREAMAREVARRDKHDGWHEPVWYWLEELEVVLDG